MYGKLIVGDREEIKKAFTLEDVFIFSALAMVMNDIGNPQLTTIKIPVL